MKNKKTIVYSAAVVAVIFGMVLITYAQQQAPLDSKHQSDKSVCPMIQGDKSQASVNSGDNHEHLAAVNERGEKAMGFSQTKTTHHFLLMRDGGAIQVEVNDPKDTASRDKIRQHLAYIAQAFPDGNFNTPMAVHDKVPPGVSVMQRSKVDIKYAYEETEKGGRVRISTNNTEALPAIHEFLRFQIKDHQTGDSLEVNK